MIQAANLSKKFRKKIAVDDVSFTVETGKVTGFLGPNGAGKSTTMRLMLGLDNGGGSTTFDGKQLHQYVRPAQVVGILLEAKAFHPTRSARNHLRILAAAGNVSDARVDEVLDLVGLKEVAKKKPGKFSLGMSQRLGIAAAILGSPKYLLLDEPANGLDPEGIAWLREFIKNYADGGNAVFVSSHLLSEMSQMADNIIVIGKGRMIADTSIKDLISSSAHSSVFVRVHDLRKLEQLLQEKSWAYQPASGGLKVIGVKIDDIGQLAFRAGMPVLELSNQSASLEEAFLELTAASQEYKTGQEHKKMIAAIKAEFRKLLTVRSTYGLIIVAFLLVMLFAFYAEGIKASPEAMHDTGKVASEVTNAVMTVSLLGALAGVLLMTHEYRYNTIMYTLTSSNSRTKTLAAKIIAISVFALLFTLLFAVLSPLLTLLGLHIRGLTLDPQQLDIASLLWRAVCFGWGMSMLGLALAVIMRNQIGVIVTLFMMPTTIEPLLGLLLKGNAVYLPFSSLGQVLQHQMVGTATKANPEALHIAMSYGKAAIISLLYFALAWAVAWVLFTRRDAN